MLETPCLKWLENPALVMLVCTEFVRYTTDMTDNATGADNQQERLIKIGWIIGFVDGEGCFSIGFIRQNDRIGRKGYQTGWQVAHEFAVTQGAKSVGCLYQMQQFFGVGQVVINKRYDNHKEHLYRYVVRKRVDLQQVVIPFFEQYSLRTSKQLDFQKFVQCVNLVDAKRHLLAKGLIEIAEITQTMNRQKSRHDLIRILTDYTPDIRDSGKDIVGSAWRHAAVDETKGTQDGVG
jgi:hypothetical protein